MRHWTKGTGSFTALASLSTASASAAMMLRRSYSATAATPSHCHYTYLLSNSSSTLYVPLTSFCNSATLPQTRGPNFVLPPEAVAALCRVRDAELRQAKWDFWCRWLDQQETLQKLPPTPETSFVAAIPEPEGDDADALLTHQEEREPSVTRLLGEVEEFLKRKPAVSSSSSSSTTTTTTIVIAGEGEPTLRFQALIHLLEQLGELIPQSASGRDSTPDGRSSNSMIRINTNGLLNADRTDQLLATCRSIQRNSINNNSSLPLLQIVLSVPIMTHDPDQYEQLMQPILLLDDDNDDKEDPGRESVACRPHERVQNFVRACVAADLAVEVTAVQRPDVDQARTEACVAALGISPTKMMMRWRKYFA